jgi:hypothetical protein
VPPLADAGLMFDHGDALPLCRRCDRPVTSASRIPDPANQRTIYKGWCHGQVDRVVVADRHLCENPSYELEFFTDPGRTKEAA